MRRVGVRAHFVTSALAAPLMVASGAGLILSVSSFAGQVFVLPVPYGVAHAAIDRLDRDMAVDLRPPGHLGLAVPRVGADRERAG